MALQISLDIEVDLFSKRQKLIIKRLGEFRTIDADIAYHERLSRGIGLRHQPSITVSPPREDDQKTLARMREPLKEHQQEIAATVAKFVTPGASRYVTSHNVARALSDTYSNDPDEDYRIRDALDILQRRHGEEHLEMTDTERLAILREQEIAQARFDAMILRERKEIITFAMEQMEKWYYEEYLILWNKYVMDQSWQKVCEIAAREGDNGKSPLSPDEYRLSRKKALKHFDKWASGLR